MPAPAQDDLRFLCFGVGAIGTYIGGSLALAGLPVVFVERSEVAEQVRERGLRLQLGERTASVPSPQIVSTVQEALALGSYDVALVAVKAFDTASLVESLAPVATALPAILCLQNGVENEQAFAGLVGKERVLSGAITTAVGRRAAGDITLERLRGVGIALEHPLAPRLVEAFQRAGLKGRGYPNTASLKWSKMLTNLLANSTSAILDMPPAQIFGHPGLFRLELGMVRETLAVMDAQAIRVCDLPGTPVRLLAWAIRSLPTRVSQPLLNQALGKGRGGKMPSFHIDLYSGRGKSEVDYLNGAVVRAGQKYGIQTPINRWLDETLQQIVAGELPIQTYAHQPEKLIAALTTSGAHAK